jgi:tyrosine aminotransferase
MRVSNPIRDIVDQLDLDKINKSKPMIPLSIGDPTKFGNLDTDRSISAALLGSVHSAMYNGYPPSDGYVESRAAVAERYSTPANPLVADDVSLTSGCSHALQICIEVLCNPGDTLLVPNPAFPLYQTIADHLSVSVSKYELLPERGWEADLEHMRAQLEAAAAGSGRVGAILVNNPSNPCGSVYSIAHLKGILALAEEFKVPIIADEIYGDMVFEGEEEFSYMAELTDVVPVLSCNGIAKRYLVPGWRLGWIVAYDKQGVLAQGGVLQGIKQLTQIIVGPNSLMQSALPTMIQRTPDVFYDETMDTLRQHAEFTVDRLSQVDCLTPVRPQGAMYVMVGVDVAGMDAAVQDDVRFAQLLLEEESVFVLPGQCFGKPNYFRIVTCPPLPKLAGTCFYIADMPHFDLCE